MDRSAPLSPCVLQLRATRYPAYPATSSVFFTQTGAPHPILLPSHVSASEFTELSSSERAMKRESHSRPKQAAKGRANGFSWELVELGVTLQLTDAFYTAQKAFKCNGGLNPETPLSSWPKFLPHYTSARDLSGKSDLQIWNSYHADVLCNTPLIKTEDALCVLFQSGTLNSFAHLTRIIEMSSTRKKEAARIFFFSVYMCVMQFWLYCNDRFMQRVATNGVYPAHLPPSPFVFHLDRDLPKGDSKPFEAVVDVSSGPVLTAVARKTNLRALLELVMASDAMVEAMKECDKDYKLDTYIKAHISRNREKSLVSRHFAPHACPDLVAYVNQCNHEEVLTTKFIQLPSCANKSVNTVQVECKKGYAMVAKVVPCFMSHPFLSFESPLFSSFPVGTFGQATSIACEESSRIRWTVDRLSHPLSELFAKQVASDAPPELLKNATPINRYDVTQFVVSVMQFLPFMSETDTASFDVCLNNYYIAHPVGASHALSIRATSAKLAFDVLPSAGHCSLATIPRSYHPIPPSPCTLRYSCYIVHTGTSMQLMRYIREFEAPPSPFSFEPGDHSIVSMPRGVWRWRLQQQVASPPDEYDAADANHFYEDAWTVFHTEGATPTQIDHYCLYQFLTSRCRSEVELVGAYCRITKETKLDRIHHGARRLHSSLLTAVFSNTSLLNPIKVAGVLATSCDNTNNRLLLDSTLFSKCVNKQSREQFFLHAVSSPAFSCEEYMKAMDSPHQIASVVSVCATPPLIDEFNKGRSFCVRASAILLDSVGAWKRREVVEITAAQLLALATLIRQHMAYDVIVELCEFQRAQSLVLHQTKHWAAAVRKVSVLDSFPSINSTMNRLVDELAPRIKKFFSEAERIAASPHARASLAQWATDLDSPSAALAGWVVSSERSDERAKLVLRMRERVVELVERPSPLEGFSRDLLLAMRDHQASTTLFTAEFYNTYFLRLAIATRSSDPVFVAAQFRRIVTALRAQSAWANACFLSYATTRVTPDIDELLAPLAAAADSAPRHHASSMQF